jgi:RNA polymerase sigma-70 factor (ECF subfamily)
VKKLQMGLVVDQISQDGLISRTQLKVSKPFAPSSHKPQERTSGVDPRTLQAAQCGDREALGLLLRELQDCWYRMSLSLLANSDLAQEATQETAIRFLKQLPGFRGDSQLRTWSLGICVNVVREIRRWSRGHGSLPDADDASLGDPAPSPDAAAERLDEFAALRTLLVTLPERQREAVMLRYFEDLSVEQTADAMGCAAGTVKATVHQALRTLKRKLQELV